jgi:hypothetical protein
MLLKGAIWIIWGKILYNVCVRKTNDYVAILEWHWEGRTEIFGEKYCILCVAELLMSM